MRELILCAITLASCLQNSAQVDAFTFQHHTSKVPPVIQCRNKESIENFNNSKVYPTKLQANGGFQQDTIETFKTPPLWKLAMAESFGTFLIVQLGCGVVCSAKYASSFGSSALFPIALIWGIAVTLAIYCMSPLESGAHFNPAITIAMSMLRQPMSILKIGIYIASQLCGAVFASLLNYSVYKSSIAAYEVTTGIVRGTGASTSVVAGAFGEYWGQTSALTAFSVEALGTAILAFVIFNLTNSKNKSNPPVPALIGMTVTALIAIFAPLTQAGFNPARDFGPRLVTAWFGWGYAVSFKGWWVYVLGPIVGALIGGFVAEKIVWAKDT